MIKPRKVGNRWAATIYVGGKMYSLGSFKNKEKADDIISKATNEKNRNNFNYWYETTIMTHDNKINQAIKEGLLLDIEKVVEKTKVARTTVLRYAKRFEVVFYKKKRYFSTADVDKMLSLYMKKNRSPKDITGRQVNFLTAIEYTGRKEGNSYVWKWRCVCGNIVEVTVDRVTSSNLQSCGCKSIEIKKKQIENAFAHINFYKDTNIDRISKMKLQANNTSGVNGVSTVIRRGKIMYLARIGFKKRQINLGVFGTLAKAAKARKLAENKYYEPIIREYKSIESMNEIRNKIRTEVEKG
jgi:hypothetical protein